VIYQEEIPKFNVMGEGNYNNYEVFQASKLKVAWNNDGEATLYIQGTKKDDSMSLVGYRSDSFKIELTVPYLVPMMDEFVRRAKEHLSKELLRRDTLVEQATAPLMPYIMARRL
jgi:hypothetical protein